MRIPIEIPTPNGTVRALFHIPKSTTNKNIVVFCYGFNGNRVEDSRLSYNLSVLCEKNGIISARFDYLGQGISDGNFSHVNLESRIISTIKVIDFLCGCLNDPNQKITVIGFSDGAKIALKVAEKDKRITNIILWNPVLIDSKSTNSTFKPKISREHSTNKIFYPIHGLPVSIQYLNEIDNLQYDLITLGNKITTFFCRDDKKSEETKSYLKKNDLVHCIKYLEQGGHLFLSEDSERIILEETLKILKKN